MKHTDELNEQGVIAHLGEARRAESLREMAHALGLRHAGRRALKKIIAKLLRRHEIEEVQNGRYALAGRKGSGAGGQGSGKRGTESGVEPPHSKKASEAPPHAKTLRPGTPAGLKAGATERRDPNVITGRIVTHKDGYGFVLPDEPVPGMEGDLYISRDAINDAMHGDRVTARIERRGRAGRAEGRVLRIEKRAHETVVGEFHLNMRPFGRERGNYVIPFDTRIKHEILIPPGEEWGQGSGVRGQGKENQTPISKERRERQPGASAEAGVKERTKGGQARSLSHAELDGAVVNVEITQYPGGGLGPAGRVIEVLGHVGDIGVDTEIISRKHHLPHEFPEEVMREAEAAPREVASGEWRVTSQEDVTRNSKLETRRERDEASFADIRRDQVPALQSKREDFRELPIVTIDGETAKDFDDAVYVEKMENGHYELQVHIADVAHYVKRAGALDREARVRGTSVYFPNRAVPMLPEALSNGICSLNPKVDRLVMSAVMEIDAHGNTVRARFTPGVIRSVERMTYTNVNKVLAGDAEMNERYTALAERFRLMKELALILSAKRDKRGSIDFDLPERVIEFDELNRMKSIVRSERNIANRIIEEFMLAANEAVANYLEKRGIASLHRVHEKPDAKKVLEFEELAKAFGYSLGVEDLAERKIPVKHGQVHAARGREQSQRHPSASLRAGGRSEGGRMRAMTVTLPAGTEINIRPQHYQALVRKIEGKAEERILSYLMLRSLKQARYAAEPLGHFALACDEYAHFTSPIRRYPDLIVHRILKWALENPGVRGQGLGVREEKTENRKARFENRAQSRSFGTAPLQGGGDPSASLPSHSLRTGRAGPPHSNTELEEIAVESSEAERRADTAERELMDWKTAQFMEQHLGDEYTGLIISVHKFGFFVELLELFVEGLVPIAAIEEFTGGGSFYRESDRAILIERGGRHRGAHRATAARASTSHPSTSLRASRKNAPGANVKAFRLGDRVRVRAERIDPFQRRVEFALV